MKEQQILELCRRHKTLKPLLQAIRYGVIKFYPLPRTPTTYFAMSSNEGTIIFENDIYFYTRINNSYLDKYVFTKDRPGIRSEIEQELSRINDKLRGIHV